MIEEKFPRMQLLCDETRTSGVLCSAPLATSEAETVTTREPFSVTHPLAFTEPKEETFATEIGKFSSEMFPWMLICSPSTGAV